MLLAPRSHPLGTLPGRVGFWFPSMRENDMTTTIVAAGRIEKSATFAQAADALLSGAVVSGEFADWFRAYEGAAAVDTMDIVQLGASLLHDDMKACFRHREAAIVAGVKAAKGKGGRAKTACPVSAGEFVAAGQPLAFTLADGTEFVVDPRVFKVGDGADVKGKENGTSVRGGSFGWQKNAEVTVQVNGKPCKVMLNVCGIIANSGEAPRGEGAELDALDAHCKPFLAKLAEAKAALAEKAAKAD